LTSEHSSQENGARGDIFATTHWTVVLAAGQRSTLQSALALEEGVSEIVPSICLKDGSV
jgi:hypothetical protein